MKKRSKIYVFLITLLMPFYALAYSDKIYVGGENIGINIKSEGIVIVGSYTVNNINNLKDSNLLIGDIIIKINNQKVKNIDEMIKKINDLNKDKINITYLRDNKEYETDLNLYKENGIYKTGLYVKDSITGIGTLTYVDPKTKIFGALGHEIKDTNTDKIFDVKEGSIFESKITSIDRSSNGNPGSKNAKLNENKEYGNIKENTLSGIFGTYNDVINNKLYKVAKNNEIKLGDAKIITVLEDNKKEEFDIEIIKINKNDKDYKNLLFKIKDKKLLEKTGGVVQGMSGSPIIQGEYIIGAVTHVIVNSPEKGYGIFITNMLNEGEN